MEDEQLVRVELHYACYGLVVVGGVVRAAPPIAHWMIGKPDTEVARWLHRRGARTTVIDTRRREA